MAQVQSDFTVKKESIGPPDRYLGADTEELIMVEAHSGP